MLRAVALRLESGAIVASSSPGTSISARRMACRPVAPMPSSLVRRIRIASKIVVREAPNVTTQYRTDSR